MNHDEINIAIAEHLGVPLTVEKWRFTLDGIVLGGYKSQKDADFHSQGMARVYGATVSKQPEPYTEEAEIPNYAGDLNAMHEARETLHGKAHPNAVTDEDKAFRDELAKILGCGWYHSARLLRTTASQQAEAFLKAVGKWKEENV